MTRQRDIGRVLDTWLAPGPTEAPDRILDVLADRIEHVPQRRHPRANERFHTMTPPILKLAAAAAVLFTIGLTIGPLVNPNPQVAASPSPAASQAPTPTPVPEALRSTWISGPPADPTSTAYRDVNVQIKDGALQIYASDGFQLGNRASEAAPGQLSLRSFAGVGGCDGAEDAIYAWSLTPGGTKLTLSPVSDACADRVTALGRQFERIDCQNPDDPCMGALEAGSYYSIEFAPGLFPNGHGVGGLTYDIPDGWAQFMDGPSNYGLSPIADYTSGAVYGMSAANAISLGSRPAAASQAVDCPDNAEEPGVGTTFDDIVAFITGHPGLVVETNESTTIDGHRATILDVVMAPTWTRNCPWFSDPIVLLLTERGQRNDFTWGASLGTDGKPDPIRLVLIDLGGGQIAHIWISADKAAGFDAFVAEAMPIVERMHFTP